jgi:hypothetical protein
MAFEEIHAAIGLVLTAVVCRSVGFRQAVRAYVEGRNAIGFERERRATLLAVPPGSEFHERRADGSVLCLRVPPAGNIADDPVTGVHRIGARPTSSVKG